jgi:hypothetical protein
LLEVKPEDCFITTALSLKINFSAGLQSF